MVPPELEWGSWEGSPVLPAGIQDVWPGEVGDRPVTDVSVIRAERAERAGRAERAERAEPVGRADRAERGAQASRAERAGRPQRAGRGERPERTARVVQLEPARKRMQAAARKTARTARWQLRRRRIRAAAAGAALVTVVGSAAIGAVGGLTAEFVGLTMNRDHAVRQAERFSLGRPAQATDSQAFVGRHDDDNGSSWAIDRVRVSLPGDPAWIETENIQGYYHRISVADPPYRDWQDPEPLHHYDAPTPVHVLSGPHGPRVMTDEDIRYWLTTPWPHFWHQARLYGWFGIGWSALVPAGSLIQEEWPRRRSQKH